MFRVIVPVHYPTNTRRCGNSALVLCSQKARSGGVKLGEISFPEMTVNLHWGGADWDTLFVCASTSLYSVQTKTKGRVEPFMFAKAPNERLHDNRNPPDH